MRNKDSVINKNHEQRGLFKNIIIFQETLDHFIILAEDYTPTIVIKKNAFSRGEIAHVNNVIKNISPELPSITYLPFHWEGRQNTPENQLLKTIKDNQVSLKQYINQDRYDISPVYDESPYFYKIKEVSPVI